MGINKNDPGVLKYTLNSPKVLFQYPQRTGILEKKHKEIHMKHKTKLLFFLTALTVLSLFITGCGEKLQAADIMELNRAGKWAEAKRASLQIIAPFEEYTPAEICEIYFNLIYAEVRLKEYPQAAQHMEALDWYIAQNGLPPEVLWLKKELAALTLEIQEDSAWTTMPPDEKEINITALNEYNTLCENIGAQASLVIHKGSIIQEWYLRDTQGIPQNLDSFIHLPLSLLTGALIDEGKITAIDDSVSKYLPDFTDTTTISDLLAAPGNTQILATLLDSVTQKSLQEYSREVLFAPLGMNHTLLQSHTSRNNIPSFSLKSSPRDLAKLALLMIQKGRMGDTQVIPAEWINAVLTPRKAERPSFGHLWLLFKDPKGYGAVGPYNSILMVFPQWDLIVVRLQNTPFEMLKDINIQHETAKLMFQLKK